MESWKKEGGSAHDYRIDSGIFWGAKFHGFRGLEANHKNITHKILKYTLYCD